MIETQYPVFQEGQTLTEEGLNLLRDFLHDRDRLMGRLVGFGVNCGLGGSVDATELRVSAGLAIDQNGEPLILTEPQVVALPPATSGSFDFVEAFSDSYTVVLASGDTTLPSTGCAEDGCDGHAELHEREARLHVVEGRLTGARFDFSSEPLLGQTPLRVSRTSNPAGAFVGLRDAILGRIGGRLESSIRAKLAGIRIETSDLPVIRAFKAGFLNQVYFAALDLLRCEALMAVTCLRTSATPGVALGWVRQVAGAWVWDCSYRHHWAPPVGLSLAFRGGTCESPCRLYVDRLEELIDNFEVPVVPEPEEDPGPGGTSPGDYEICIPGRHGRYVWDYCDDIVVFPPEEIPPDWIDWYTDPPFPPDPGWVDPVPPHHIYEVDPLDWLETGVVSLAPGFGGDAGGVRDALEELFAGTGIEPNVHVVTVDEIDGIEGYAPTGAVSPADTVIITQDGRGKVIATGHVPATRSVRNVGTQLPMATEAAGRAVAETESLRHDLDGMATGLEGVNGRLDQIALSMDGFTDFQTEISQWRSTTEVTLDGMDDEIRSVGARILGDFEVQLAGRLPEMINQAVEHLRVGITETVVAQTGQQIEAGLRELETRFSTQMGSTAERVGQLEGSLEQTVHQVDRSSGRIDQILQGKARGLTESEIGRAIELNEGLLGVVRTMRESIDAAAPRERTARVERALAAADEAIGRLETGTRPGGLLVTGELEALNEVLDSMTAAISAAGAGRSAVTRVRRSTTAFRELVGG